MESVWRDSVQLPSFPMLEEKISTEVLIIGGGMCGILCAYMLQQAGVPYILLEADRICSGVTANTTAKITSQHGLLYSKLQRRFGSETAKEYYRLQQAALARYRTMAQTVDCDLEDADAYLYTLQHVEKLKKECATLQQIGAPAEFLSKLDLPFAVAGAIRLPGQSQFHPLKFVSGIAKDLNIREHSAVRAFDGEAYQTGAGSVRARKTIVTTHFPIWNKHGAYFLKLYQHRSYVLALENAGKVNGMYVDESGKGLSLRMYGDLLLLGGGSHRTGQNGGGWKELERVAREYYPEATIRYRWATQDCMTLDGMPYIGRYSRRTPDLLVATGFQKWGMTGSMVAAELLRDIVLGKGTAHNIFSPSRSMLHPQLAVNGAHAIWNLIRPSKPRCPHLGCALQWNDQENTWDCPCLGSRFAPNGKRLDGPATGDRKATRSPHV